MGVTAVWLDTALEDLERILIALAEESPRAAEQLKSDMFKTVSTLETFPYLGSLYEGTRNRRIREILCQRYRIFYRVLETSGRLEIMSVWHSSRPEPRLPK